MILSGMLRELIPNLACYEVPMLVALGHIYRSDSTLSLTICAFISAQHDFHCIGRLLKPLAETDAMGSSLNAIVKIG